MSGSESLPTFYVVGYDPATQSGDEQATVTMQKNLDGTYTLLDVDRRDSSSVIKFCDKLARRVRYGRNAKLFNCRGLDSDLPARMPDNLPIWYLVSLPKQKGGK